MFLYALNWVLTISAFVAACLSLLLIVGLARRGQSIVSTVQDPDIPSPGTAVACDQIWPPRDGGGESRTGDSDRRDGVLAFISADCPACRMQLDQMENVRKNLTGLRIVAVDDWPEDDLDRMRSMTSAEDVLPAPIQGPMEEAVGGFNGYPVFLQIRDGIITRSSRRFADVW